MQGLSRFEEETGLSADYIVVEVVKSELGEDRARQFIGQVKQGGVEQILL